MACKICENHDYIDVLTKNAIPIWTGSSEIEDDFYPCNLKQCTKCGHVYEEISAELSDKLSKIYSSSHAQASTPPGNGNWGLARAEFFLNKINYQEYTSAIEIGCADGFFLRFLENNGYKKLIGIEPSLSENSTIGKIEFISAFANEKTQLNEKVDLIFSNAVFEHIEDINGVLTFCKNHLNVNGELFFAVPHAQIELETNDPALFIHEHVHYYTKDVLTYLLAQNGFEIKSIIQECSATYVSAVLNDKLDVPSYTPRMYSNYSKVLNEKLAQFENIMDTNKKIIIHGANNKLNNILGWSKKKFSFTLVDNDDNKYHHYFFDHQVHKLGELNLKEYDCIVIIPACFYETIKNEYIKMGFLGKFYQI